MNSYDDDAIVLRTQKLGEADRIVTFLTHHHGQVRAVAKGVRRTKSRFGARVEPFAHVAIQFHRGRSNLDIVTQVITHDAFGGSLSADYGRYTSGSAMLEMAERLTQLEREPNVDQYMLLLGGLRSLSRQEHATGLILDAYLLRALAVAGWAVALDVCARCGAAGPHRAFAIAAGGVVCTQCRPPGSAAPAAQTVELMGALLTSDWATADASDERTRREAAGLIAAFAQYHLESGLRSLRLVDRSEVAQTGPDDQLESQEQS